MSKNFEIFTTQSALDTKTSAINTLLNYPDVPSKTDTYREGFQKYQGTDWAGVVDDKLVTACASMTPSERAQYYDDSDLKTYQWLVDNNWYDPS